jgi:hypothetical protein
MNDFSFCLLIGSIVLGYFSIGAFAAGVMRYLRAIDEESDYDTGLWMILPVVFWPILIPLCIIMIAEWFGRRLMAWLKKDNKQ